MGEFHIVELDEITAKIDEIKEASNFIPDASTDDGYSKSKRVSLDIGKVKTNLEKTRKAKKQEFLEGGRAVDSQAKTISQKLDEMQAPHLQAYKNVDNIKKEREIKRKQELDDRVAYIRNLPESLAECSSDEIMPAIKEMGEQECLDFYEYTVAALEARNLTRDLLAKLYTKKKQEEKDAEELEALRKAKVIQDQKDRDERIAREASEKAEKEKAEAIEREAKAKQDLIDAEAKAKQRSIAAEWFLVLVEAHADNDKFDSDKRAIEAQRIAKENADIAAEKARLDEIARQEAEAETARLAQEKLEANKAHVGKVRRSVKEFLMSFGIEEAAAKAAVIGISKKQNEYISINY